MYDKMHLFSLLGKILKNDPNCLKIGGICVDKETCPPNNRVNQTGLCAQQQHREGICCHGSM